MSRLKFQTVKNKQADKIQTLKSIHSTQVDSLRFFWINSLANATAVNRSRDTN